MKKDNSLVVVGSVALDSVKSPFGEVNRALGGSAVYFSCAARHFCDVHLVGVVGKDFHSDHVRLLRKLGVNIDGLDVVEGKTFHWKGYYEKDLNQAITVNTELNVFSSFNPELNKRHRQVKHLFLANIDPKLQLNVLKQVKKPRWIASDTMNLWIDIAKPTLTNVLKRVDISLMNDAEIRQFTGEDHLIKAVKKIMKIGPKVVVVKRGEYGAWCFTANGHFAMPAFLLEDVKDPTGAGDSFAGGFLGYLSNSKTLTRTDVKKAVMYGSLVASFNVQSFSVERLAKLRKTDLSKRLKDYKKMLAV